MALRIFQFGFVFAIGLFFHPASSGADVDSLTKARTGVRNISQTLYVKDPQDVIVARGQSATLRCDVNSTLPTDVLRVSWYHNDVPIPNNDIRRIVRSNHSLYIPKVVAGKRPLTGEYRCKVQNNIGSILTNPAKVQIAYIERELDDDIEDISVPEFQPIVLHCPIKSVPAPKIKWEYNKQPLPQYLRYVPFPSGSLLILSTTSSHAGSYKCTATNTVLKKSKDKSISLSVQPELTKYVTLSFLSLNSTNVTVLPNQNVNLYCMVSGWPSPKIQWIKNETVIANTSVLQIQTGTLLYKDNYTCIAYNFFDRISQTFWVDVQQKPYFIVTPKAKAYTSASTVRLECQVKGFPEPCIYWLKNGEKLKIGRRIKKQASGGLIFSHTFSYDEGIYQCVAINRAGSAWAGTQIVLNSTVIPSPPTNVQCRPYDEKSICVTWDPTNSAVVAYSVYFFYTVNRECMGESCNEFKTITGCDDPLDELGPDHVTSSNHDLVSRLNTSTNYTFYVRLYERQAVSDNSQLVQCKLGVQGERNLQFKIISDKEIEIRWSQISTDIACGASERLYTIQWKKEGYSSINSSTTGNTRFIMTGLQPMTTFSFRVLPTNRKNDESKWVSLLIPKITDEELHKNYIDTIDTNLTEVIPSTPEEFGAISIKATSVLLDWSENGNDEKGYYTVCFVAVKEYKMCENGNLLKSATNSLKITNLKPNTQYEFKVRAHNNDGLFGLFSLPIEIQTDPDVPSPVFDLKYKVVNDSTACLAWKPPIHKNGNLVKYVVCYTSNPNLSLGMWPCFTVSAIQTETLTCWLGNNDIVSTLLFNLNPSERYTILVRAGSDVGLSNPTLPLNLVTGLTNHNGKQMPKVEDDFAYKQKIGVVAGCISALTCIICCVSCIVLRRQCIKRRALAQARLAASNNYYPAVARFATQGNLVQVRLENTCSADLQETEQLVGDDHQTNIPPVNPTHLDSKGNDTFPNGHMNGFAKPLINGGHLMNGHVHITENPQFQTREKNNLRQQKKDRQNYKHYKEDSNSNLQSPRFKDIHRLFETSMNRSPDTKHYPRRDSPNFDSSARALLNGNVNNLSHNNCSLNSTGSNPELDSTQSSYLDDSFQTSIERRRISPLLGPNG